MHPPETRARAAAWIPEITDKIAKLSGEEPWAGYDEQSADAIVAVLRDAEPDPARLVRAYERDRKARSSVIERPPISAPAPGSQAAVARFEAGRDAVSPRCSDPTPRPARSSE